MLKLIGVSFLLLLLMTPLAVVGEDHHLNETYYDPGDANEKDAAEKLGLEGFEAIIYSVFTGLGGIVLWFGGLLLDYSLAVLVVDMGGFIENMGIGSAINGVWTLVRDIFNILFIFGLIYIGFKTILGLDESSTRKMLVNIIIAALLINFSLYITKVVVDFSNRLAYEIHQLIPTDRYNSKLLGDIDGVAGRIYKKTDMQSYAADNAEQLKAVRGDGGGTFKVLGFALIVMVFMLVTGFVLLAGAFLMISRFVGLVIFMMLSPVMFLGRVLPKFEGVSSAWWKKFLNYAFVAPAYLFMLYLGLFVLENIKFDSSFGEAYSADPGLFGIFLYYLLIIGFMYAALRVAKEMGAYGASQSMALGGYFRKKAQVAMGAATVGGLAAAGRVSVGQLAQRRADSDVLLERASKSGIKGWAARRELALQRKIGDAGFDARRVGGVGKKLGIGEGSKGGYKTKRDAYVKKQEAFAKSLGEVGDDDVKVAEYKAAVKAAEDQVSTAAKTNDPKAKQEAKEALQVAKENLQWEKQRRQTGGAEFNRERKGIEASLKAAQQKHSDLIQQQKQLPDKFGNYDIEKRKELDKQINETKTQIREQRKQLKENGGYADVLAHSGALASLFSGHAPNFDAKAGEAVRKKYNKKVKQSKEDRNFDGLKEELGKLKKDDD